MRRPRFHRLLGIVAAGVLTTGCGGSSSAPSAPPAPSPTPIPSSSAIVSGGRLVANGSNGVTFTFAVGAGVPAGELAFVSVLPPTQCSGTGCTAVQPPLDGFELSVGPQPLAVSALPSVALAGVQTSFAIRLALYDMSAPGAYTTFSNLNPAGGPITIVDPGPGVPRPILTLVPNHVYAVAIYSTGLPPS